MRLLKYLNEQYLEGVKVGGRILDVYKNPTPLEMRDLRNSVGYGFRFIIDTENKNFYVADAEYTHSTMFDKSKELRDDLKGFSYGVSYYRKGEGLDRVLTGSTERTNFNEIFSDTLSADISMMSNYKNYQHCYDQLQKLIKKDFSFMSKWIKPQLIKDLIQENIDRLKNIMTGEEDPDD